MMRSALGAVMLLVLGAAACGDDTGSGTGGAGAGGDTPGSTSTSTGAPSTTTDSSTSGGDGGGAGSGGAPAGGGGSGGAGAGSTVHGVVKGYRGNSARLEQHIASATIAITDGTTSWTTTSDSNGVFSLDGIPPGEGYRVTVTVPEDGPDTLFNGATYGKWQERLTVLEGTPTPLAPVLVRGCSTPITVDAGQPATHTPEGWECSVSDIVGHLSVPAGGLIDARGEPFGGAAELKLAPLHYPSVSFGAPDLHSARSMPGDLVGSDGDQQGLIHTYAAADVRIVDPATGEALQMADGAVAQLTMRAWREMTEDEDILSWSFDEEQQIWIQEGICAVDPVDPQLVTCELRHFSWWNADGKSPGPDDGDFSLPDRCVRGTVYYETEPVAGALVSAITVDGMAGGGDVATDANGEFCVSSATRGGWSVQVRMPNDRVVLRGDVSVAPQSGDATCSDDPEDCAQAGDIELHADTLITVRGTLGVCDAALYPEEICGPMPEGGFEYGNTVRVNGFLADLVTEFYLGEIQIADDGSYEIDVPDVIQNILFFTPDGYCHTYNADVPGDGNPVTIEGRSDMMCGS